jgi:hypothetical protein
MDFASTYLIPISTQNSDWSQEDAELPGPSSNSNGRSSDHLWEESWDDDDTNEDFSKQLKYVLPFTPVVSLHVLWGIVCEKPQPNKTDLIYVCRREELKKVEAAKQ